MHVCSTDLELLPSILILFATANTSNMSSRYYDIAQSLQSTNEYLKVDLFDVSLNAPSPLRLARYQAILVGIDDPFQFGEVLVNVLAQFWNAGGIVIQVAGLNASCPTSLGRRFGAQKDGYLLIKMEEASPLYFAVPTVDLNESGIECLKDETSMDQAVFFVSKSSCTPLILCASNEDRQLVSIEQMNRTIALDNSSPLHIRSVLNSALQYAISTSGACI